MPSAPAARCVFCRRQPVDPASRPFCGERCRLLDLAKWASGDYRVAGDAREPEPPEDEPPP